MRESLDIIIYPSKDEKFMYDEFQDVFYAVRYKKLLAKSTRMNLVHKL